MKKSHMSFVVLIFSLFFFCNRLSFAANNDWVNINGTVTYNSSPVCAMVLANGQYMFTSSGDGSFNLDVPLDPVTGQITVFAFCEGLAPFEQVIYPAEGNNMAIDLEDAAEGPGLEVDRTLIAINTSMVRLTGTVSYGGSPVCAMVLANGQYMFTSSGDGSYSLDVPIDPADGSVTLYSFCSGLPPYKYVFTTDQISFNNDTDSDGYSINEGDYHDLDPSINPGATEICGDGIDQDCNGSDLVCIEDGKIVQNLLIGVKKDAGGGFNNAYLNGRYWFRRLGIHDFETNYREAETCYGYIDFNGAGSWAGQATCFDSDGISESIPSFSGTYSVNTNGSFTFIFNTSIDTGHISSDRNFAILSEGSVDSSGINQGIITAVKAPDNPFSRSDLNGTWQERDLEVRDFEEDFREASACKGTIVINNPNWNGNFNCFESDGTTDVDTLSGTYTITGNTFDFFITGYSAVAFSAYLSRDGNILTFTHGSSLFGDIGLFKGIALKKTTKTYTNADLSGTYFFHDAYIEDFVTDNREFSITVGALTFDGNGNWTGTANSFDSDGSSGSGNISGNYSVNSDGSFTLTVTSETPNETLTGNISGDNNTIIMRDL